MMPDPSATPNLLLSLDFELRWGVHDVMGEDINAYRAELEGVAEVVPALLGLFEELEVRTTWACVGALACDDWQDYFDRAPAGPVYDDPVLRFDPRWADRDPDGRQHFAPQLIERIAKSPGQEVASHTFGHIYFGEMGLMKRDVVADTKAATQALAQRSGYAPQSLVFPRNQVHFLDTLGEQGVKVVRGNAPGWWWRRSGEKQRSTLLRSLRLVSTYRPQPSPVGHLGGVTRLNASAFLRLGLGDAAFEQSCRALERAAARLSAGQCLHLWFHPHNLGRDPRRQLARVRRALSGLREAAPASAQWRTFNEFVPAA